MFLEFVNRKKAEKFNENVIKAVKGRASLMQIGVEGSDQIFKIVINPDAKRTVCFVAGLHGDEEGGPLGALSFLESNFHVPTNKRVIIIPLANPRGFELGKRENAEDMDINRHFLKKELKGECKFIWDALKHEDIDLVHTLHEDPELKTFCLYYTHHLELAKDLRELATQYFDIFAKEKRKPLEGDVKHSDKMINGIIPLPHTVKGTLEDKCLIEKAIPYIITESPGKVNLKNRIEYNKNAIKASINGF